MHKMMLFLSAMVLAISPAFSINAYALTSHERIEYNEAFLFGYITVVKKYVEADHANVNYIFAGGYTPLQVAVNNGQTDVVKYLISKGVDVDYVNKESGETAFKLAVINKNKLVTALLLKNGAVRFSGETKYLKNQTILQMLQENRYPEMANFIKGLSANNDSCFGINCYPTTNNEAIASNQNSANLPDDPQVLGASASPNAAKAKVKGKKKQ